MGTKLKTVSVRLDEKADARLDRASHLLHQSKGAFLAQAGDQEAQRVLLDWAAQQYRAGTASLSELAAETGVPLEAISQQISSQGAEEAMELYLGSCKKLAEAFQMPDFYTKAQQAVQLVVEENQLS
ncbi:MAG: hypothetical protein EXR50_03325 [Dehalococcoidia bacterium]|nr:hypothetical protein [Dehalococcoidia bacterium]